VRREAFHLVVDPKNGFGAGHGGKVRRGKGKVERGRENSLARCLPLSPFPFLPVN
jgi:hypothetical protein